MKKDKPLTAATIMGSSAEAPKLWGDSISRQLDNSMLASTVYGVVANQTAGRIFRKTPLVWDVDRLQRIIDTVCSNQTYRTTADEWEHIQRMKDGEGLASWAELARVPGDVLERYAAMFRVEADEQ